MRGAAMLLAIVLGTFAAAFGIYFGTGFVFASLPPLWKGIAQLVVAVPLAFGAAIGVVIIGHRSEERLSSYGARATPFSVTMAAM